MKVDPFSPPMQKCEYVLCENGAVILHDESSTTQGDLLLDDTPFAEFCKSLDPNSTFLTALVPRDEDRPVFFAARDAVGRFNLHMQSTLEKEEQVRRMWDSYRESKRFESAEEAQEGTDEAGTEPPEVPSDSARSGETTTLDNSE